MSETQAGKTHWKGQTDWEYNTAANPTDPATWETVTIVAVNAGSGTPDTYNVQFGSTTVPAVELGSTTLRIASFCVVFVSVDFKMSLSILFKANFNLIDFLLLVQ